MFPTRRSWFRVGCLAFFLFMTANALYAADYTVYPEYVFTPKGFDDDDTVEIVVDGWKKSSCDTVLPPKVSIHDRQRTISIELLAQSGGDKCLPVMTRFTAKASLGVLAAGKYEVIANNGWLVESLQVEEASSGGPTDEDLAKITRVEIDYAPDRATVDGRWTAVLFGEYSQTCEQLGRVETTVDDRGRVTSILPILERMQTVNGEARPCEPTREEFITRVPLRDFTEAGRYMIHVRSQGGQLIDKVFSVGDLDVQADRGSH